MCLSVALLLAAPARAEHPPIRQTEPLPIELGDEWVEFRNERSQRAASARDAFDCGGWWYLPNRVLDIFDIVRADLGLGLSTGAVGRITRWGQFGYRDVDPYSLRVGLFGRDWPVLVEQSVEQGIGPWFNQSRERDVADFELGAGLDLFVAGAYVGLNVGGAVDFVGGLFCLDPSQDDRAE